MKYIRILFFIALLLPITSFAADDFKSAAQLLAAAKNADISQVQALVNDGANINFVDNTGLSIVCTAIMNKDYRAAQILQMYGADASKCDKQIKTFNQKQPKQESGGLFGGLSSAQTIALAAAGAAVVVGGVLLLPDLFSSGSGNGSSATNSCPVNTSCTCSDGTISVCTSRGTCNCSSSGGGGTATTGFSVPYGPAMPDAVSEAANYNNNVNLYGSGTGIVHDNFALMTNTFGQNYLLMMRGYSPLGRGYLGMRTIRNEVSFAPISLSGNNLGDNPVMGGRPVNVAVITANGINATADSSLGENLMLWTTVNANGTIANGASNDMLSSKYYNNLIDRGGDNNSILDDGSHEDSDANFLALLDLSNSGTAINNSMESNMDNLLGKVIGGKTAGYTNADFIGFMPNGQMTIFRTGGGFTMKNASGAISGTFVDKGDSGFNSGDELNLFGLTFTVAVGANGSDFTATDTTDAANIYNGYVGADGKLYIDDLKSGRVGIALGIQANNDLTLDKTIAVSDYLNYKALYSAGAMSYAGDLSGGRSRVDILANAAIPITMRGPGTETVSDILATTSSTRKSQFISLVNKYYDRDVADGAGGTNALPGTDAANFFGSLGSLYFPLVVFGTGAFETDNLYSGKTAEATFENSAPLIFENLQHLFMSVAAVGLTGTGTSGATSITGYSPTGKIALSQWQDTTDGKYYKARTCGIGGSGAGGVDPWCFSAAGLTDELAVASMAGAAGAMKSAFAYMNNRQLFALMALTADGPYLASNTDSSILNAADLKAHLMATYTLPTEYQYRVDSGGEDYIKVFKEVFGYGLVNLERATKPSTKVYYYDGTKIVSASGNAYWRSASNTTLKTSGVWAMSDVSISVPFYDVLESVDGTLSLPRVWKNEINAGASKKSGLYMGNVLGEFAVIDDANSAVKIGDISFQMSASEKSYSDNMSGLDNVKFGYSVNDFDMTADYQRYFTDGANRFSGAANPLLSLSSNTASGTLNYKAGNWSFGARGFSGTITDEGLLENDPTISSQYNPAKLGLVQGAAGNLGFANERFSITSSIGNIRESDTILGAQTSGLLYMGAGDTIYADNLISYSPAKDFRFSGRATFAQTASNASGELVFGLSKIESNAFSVSADIHNFSITAAAPLSITDGNMQYAHAEFDTAEDENGDFYLVVRDTQISNLDLSTENRELRFSGSYRKKLGDFTDGAFGFIYRVNPNNTNQFGEEAIFLMKISHKLGI